MSSLTHKTPKVGLALSGGAARGLAQIGVLKALEEESIPIDMIAGTSMGAIVGACYAKERKASILEEMALRVDWKRQARLVDPNLLLLQRGFVQGKKVKSFLSSLIGDVKFEDLRIPFAVVAADVETMEHIVISEGSVIEALRASISMPVLFTPVEWQGRILIDGGVVNPMPVDVVRNLGAEVVIAVNTLFVGRQENSKGTANEEVKSKPNSHTERGKMNPHTPNILDVLMKSIHAMEYEIVRLAAESADIVIRPDVKHIGTFEFYKGEEAISQGYKATKDVLPRIQELILCP